METLSTPSHSHSQDQHGFHQCLINRGLSSLIYTRSNPSFLPILDASIDNRRFVTPSTRKPIIIVTPESEHDIQAVVICSKKHGIPIRIRSGGHDFEGLSSRCLEREQFAIIDLFKLSNITIDVDEQTAWVEAGATLGQLYYEISKVSQTLAFPGGFCPTVGVGGHFSGGGFGQLFRKYGLAADNVIDARLINANGDVLDRDGMGKDHFWAIRGGGGGSFGIVTAWKVKLVAVPEVLTMFAIDRTLDQDAAGLVQQWQTAAPDFPDDIYFAVQMRSINDPGTASGKTIKASFTCIFNGQVEELLDIFEERFPDLCVEPEDCLEASWIQSLLFFNGYSIEESPKVLADRNPPIERCAYKRKADYVIEPIPDCGLEGIWRYLHEAQSADAIFIANGGIMIEIPESALPFPHRAGHLYEILVTVKWPEAEPKEEERYLRWSRELYGYMTPYVSKSPRAAYINYRDLDLGVNDKSGLIPYLGVNDKSGLIPYWGIQYFKGNLIKLMSVKAKVDPGNFFKHEQSIPAFPRYKGKNIENPI